MYKIYLFIFIELVLLVTFCGLLVVKKQFKTINKQLANLKKTTGRIGD